MNTGIGICRATLPPTTIKFVATRDSVVNALLLAYVALTPLLLIPVAGMLGASDLLFFPAIALSLIVARPRHFATPHLLMAIFLVMVGASLLQSRDFEYVMKWVRLIGITLPFFLAAFCTVSLQKIVRVFFWSGLVAILIGIVMWWFNVTPFEDEANQRLWLENGDSRVRASGLFGNSGAFGALIAMWTVTCGMFAINAERPSKLVLATILLVSILGLLASTSRVCLFAIVLGLGTGITCMLVTRLRHRGFRLSGSTISLGIFSIIVMIAALCLIAPQLMEAEWLNATMSRFDPRAHQSSNKFLSGRVTIWQHYVSSMNEWGIFGVGYKQGKLHFATSPHNQFLAVAAECGIPCLCVFLLFVVNVISTAILRRRDKPLEAMICIAVIFTFLSDSMGGEPLGSWQITPITMLFLGICVSRFGQPDFDAG